MRRHFMWVWRIEAMRAPSAPMRYSVRRSRRWKMDSSTPERGLSGVVTFGGGARISAVVEQSMEPWHTPYPVIAAALLLASVAPCLGDDIDSASKPRPTAYALCANDVARLPACKDGSFHRLEQEVDAAVKAALAKAPPTTVPILMRDQFWFREMIGAVIDDAAGGATISWKCKNGHWITSSRHCASASRRCTPLRKVSAAPASPGAGPTHSGRSRSRRSNTKGTVSCFPAKQATAGPPTSCSKRATPMRWCT